MDKDYLLTVNNILSKQALLKDKYINLLLNDLDILNNYKKNKYITPIGHYKIVSTPIKYDNGETICVFSTVKM